MIADLIHIAGFTVSCAVALVAFIALVAIVAIAADAIAHDRTYSRMPQPAPSPIGRPVRPRLTVVRGGVHRKAGV